MAAGILTEKDALIIEQGAFFEFIVEIFTDSDSSVPLDITGYSARFECRKPNADGDTVLEIDSTDTLVTDNKVITIDGSNGKLTIQANDTVTAALDAFPKGYFDVEIDDGAGVVTRVLQGAIKCSREANR